MTRGTGLATAVTLATVLGIFGAAPAFAADGPPPPGSVRFESVTVNGSGCPRGTAALAAAPDNTGFTAIFNEVRAQVGGDSKPGAFRKNCQMNVDIRPPEGYSYSISQADHEGYASLASGAAGSVRLSIYFSGQAPQQSVIHQFSGPFEDYWQFQDGFGPESQVWSPCHELRPVNINTDVRASLGTSDRNTVSYVALGSGDGTARFDFHLAWKQCTAAR